MKRNDPHRPGAIVPRDYSFECSYALASTIDGEPVPSVNMDEVCDLQDAARAAGEEIFGGPGKCGVCGACYIYGDLWRHEPTGALVHLGHDCAAKYSLVADRDDWSAKLETARRQVLAAATRRRNMERHAAELRHLDAKHPGLAAALEVEHEIITDIAERFYRFGSMSDKQIALVLRLADEIKNPRPVEVNVPAPRTDKRIQIEGEIVSVKSYDNGYRTQLKMTIKVRAEGGVWLAWGTAPDSILWEQEYNDDGTDRCARPVSIKGRRVRLTAALKPGREPHFALFSRPTKAELLPEPAAAAAA